jgi:hypothetical protein
MIERSISQSNHEALISISAVNKCQVSLMLSLSLFTPAQA